MPELEPVTVAVAVTVVRPLTVAPSAGCVRQTVTVYAVAARRADAGLRLRRAEHDER